MLAPREQSDRPGRRHRDFNGSHLDGRIESVREQTAAFSCFESLAVASHPFQPGFLIRRFLLVAKFVLIGSRLAGGESHAGRYSFDERLRLGQANRFDSCRLAISSPLKSSHLKISRTL